VAPGETLGRDKELLATEDPHLATLPYERLLDEAMRGDQMLFARQDEVEAQWRVVDPVLGDVAPLHMYEPGTRGPPEADQLAPCGFRNPLVAESRASA
jgi:glucose-6-phosphate 1-dehydrogenase